MNIIVYLKEKAEARFQPEIRHRKATHGTVGLFMGVLLWVS